MDNVLPMEHGEQDASTLSTIPATVALTVAEAADGCAGVPEEGAARAGRGSQQ